MFGFFKKTIVEDDKFIGHFKGNQKSFLEAADNAYLLTFKQLDMTHFAKYASRSLYMTIYRSLTLERPWAGVSDKFKKTTWTYVENNQDGGFSVLKSTVFDKVNVTKQLKLSVADDYKELWVIGVKNTGDYVVNSISEVR